MIEILFMLWFIPLWFIPLVLIAVWIDLDAKKCGMSPWYATLPLPVFILSIPFLVFDVGFALILVVIFYTLVVIGWLALRRKHPLLKTQIAQQPAPTVSVQPPAPQIPPMLCPNCQKPVQSEWISCPYCRTLLKPEAEETEKKRRQDALNAVEELLNKEANFFVDDIKSCLSKNDFEGAEKLLEEKKRLYDRFLELKKGMNDIDKRTAKLSTKLAEGEVTSDAYERAREDLERGKRDIEEEMWKIQNKIFREKYEKPF